MIICITAVGPDLPNAEIRIKPIVVELPDVDVFAGKELVACRTDIGKVQDKLLRQLALKP